MISKEIFCETLKAIENQMILNSKNAKVLEEMFKSYVMFHEVTPIVDELIKILMKLSGDTSNWIEWYIYETNFGKHTNDIKIDGVKSKVDSPERLYDVIKGEQ